MATPLPPGIGNSQQAAQATGFIREQPWYLDVLQRWGKDPNAQLNLSDQQEEQLAALAQQHGIGMNSRYDEIGPNGDIVEGHHKLKKSLIAAGIGGLALTGFGAAGIGPLAGAMGGGVAAGAGGAAAASIPTTMGIGSATALGLPVTAGLGTAGAVGAGVAAALPTLASTSTVPATGALVPATTSSLGGGSTSILSNLKTAYDWYNKGSQVYDSVTGGNKGGPSPGSSLTQTAGSIEQGRLNALIQKAKLQQEQDQLALSRTNAGVNVGNLDLSRRKFALTVPGQYANDSVRGDVLANSRDATISGLPSYIHVPNISGGMRPSMLSDNSRQLGAKMSRDALTSSMSGDATKFGALPTVPDATPLPESNGLDTALQGAAGVGSVLDTLGRFGSHGTSGASSPQVQPGGSVYDGAGTPGYPGDGTSGSNPMIPPPPNGPNDQQADPTPTGAGDGTMDPSILEWLRRNGQAS